MSSHRNNSLRLRHSPSLSRRDGLKYTGSVLATAAFHPWAAFASESVSPVMVTLSTYMSEARTRALPDEVVEKLKHHILDTVAAMVSGPGLAPGIAAIRFARANAGD